jgi:hypothetical protein
MLNLRKIWDADAARTDSRDLGPANNYGVKSRSAKVRTSLSCSIQYADVYEMQGNTDLRCEAS